MKSLERFGRSEMSCNPFSLSDFRSKASLCLAFFFSSSKLLDRGEGDVLIRAVCWSVGSSLVRGKIISGARE